ncbi:MAG: acyl-CoA dehydrogenase family protein [Chloroflexi bacterium]|nr:acyl-CoA dehydrogenase family protein [Chloroflexota bacterium]
MDWDDNESQAQFRSEVRAFIASQLPERYKRIARGEEDGDSEFGGWQSDRKSQNANYQQAAQAWAQALGEKRWSAPAWPAEYGGAGLTPFDQFIFNQEMARAGAPGMGVQGTGMLGPMLIVHGSEEQKKEYLPKILSGEVVWAQGYSEPGAGSDLASLQTRAVRDGDEYVINGQKIWTSGAHMSDWLFALVRTDPDAPKHRGISFLVMDINTPGITIRPLIDMTWNHGFNETFFEDVRVPVSQRVGEENRGWYVGMTLLDFERSNISGSEGARRSIEGLRDFLGTDEGKAVSRLEDLPTLRHQIADRYIEVEIQFQFSFRIISIQGRGLVPNHEASVAKLFNSEFSQRLANTGVKTFGLYSNLWYNEPLAPMKGAYTRSYVGSVASTIAGGSSEIQRNVIATRGLGLPRG